jgi:hypothetical protein
MDMHRLEEVLDSVGEHLVVDTEVAREVTREVTTSGDATDWRERRGVWRGRRLVGAAAAVLAAVLLVATPAGGALLDWLGVGSTSIRVDDTTPLPGPDSERLVDGLEPIDAATAERLLGVALPRFDTSSIGPPDMLYRVPEGGVLAAWQSNDTTLWMRRAVGEPELELSKWATSAAQVRVVENLGEVAAVVEGEHGLSTPHRTLAASTVVLWVSRGWELRLESAVDGDADQIVALARDLDQLVVGAR